MKKFFLFTVLSLGALFLKAQNPVSWNFSAKKIADKKYEIHLTATVQQGWHLYSQVQPSDAVVNPTTFVFNSNPLLAPEGKIKEMGKMEKFHDEKLGISAHQYAGSVDFVQVIKLKAKAKTNIAGVVQFQTCDDKKCLPPKKVNFNIPII
ncbi:MAG: hypothetical protein JST09_01900 [Bacteroidetes bacterium]|nr:hypothetical protein [Bacteroidota bacterium]